MTRATQHAQSPMWRHGPPLLVGGAVAVFTAFVVQVFPTGIYDGLIHSTSDELKWIRFGEWQVAETADAPRFGPGQPAEYRDGEPFVRLIYDVQLRQYRYEEEDGKDYYRNHARISINVPRAIVAAISLAAVWILGWILWLRWIGPRQTPKKS